MANTTSHKDSRKGMTVVGDESRGGEVGKRVLEVRVEPDDRVFPPQKPRTRADYDFYVQYDADYNADCAASSPASRASARASSPCTSATAARRARSRTATRSTRRWGSPRSRGW